MLRCESRLLSKNSVADQIGLSILLHPQQDATKLIPTCRNLSNNDFRSTKFMDYPRSQNHAGIILDQLLK